MNINAFKTGLMKFHKKNHRLYCVFIFKFFCNIIADYIFLKSILFNSFRDERCDSLFSLKVENNSKKNVNIYFNRPKIEYIKYIYLAEKNLRANWHRTDAPINNSFRSNHLVN